MPELFPAAPNIVDLSWRRHDKNGDFVARSTKAFLELWFAERDRMFAMGFTCHTGNLDGQRTACVRWDLRRARRGYIDDIRMLEEQYATAIGFAKSQQRQIEEVAAQHANGRAASELAHAKAAAARSKRVRALQDDAAVLLAMSPDVLTVTQHHILSALVDRDDLHDTDIAQLRRVLDALNDGGA